MANPYFASDLIILIFIVVFSIIIGILIHFTINAINRLNNQKKDDHLESALRLLNWSITIHWITAAFLVIFAFVYVFLVRQVQSYAITITEVVIAITYLISSVLILIAINEVRKSEAHRRGSKETRDIIQLGHLAASMSAVMAVGIVIWGIILTNQFQKGEAAIGIPFGLQAAEEIKTFTG